MSSRGIIKQFNGEHYERIRVLGKGSFGTAIVYRRQADCALIVMKEIDLSKFKYERDKLMALQEAKIMSELSHQNIIEYYNTYATDTKLIIEMEYAKIGTLDTYLSYQNNQLLDEEEILYIFRQITLGLNYLHSKNIVHLDLKMANIFIIGEGTVKIGDFGIAQFMSKASTTSTIDNDYTAENNFDPSIHLGTLAYSSPERCLGEASSNHFKSDIWSLGCILYELITLKPLFASESLPELVMSITQVKYRPIERKDIMSSTRHLFEQMIARDLNERPSVDELVSMCDQLIARKAQRLADRGKSGRRHNRRQTIASYNNKFAADMSTEAAAFYAALDKRTTINYPHSLIYQVRLDTPNILIDRVNLPQTKRIKEIAKGRSHYLVLTYDSIVYGWGSRDCGQLGACSHLQRSNSLLSNQTERSRRAKQAGVSSVKTLRSTGSARSSFTARDIQLLSPLTTTLRGFSASSSNHINNNSGGGGGGANSGTVRHQVSLTQPPSLASSTQTIVDAGQRPSVNHQLDRQLASMLDVSRPATKPFIIQELNKRKIDHIAAGNDFSVFLSKTGILMTCGDGSTGCLGRGDLQSSLSPRMIDSLLNMDVVGIACGPEHVVAICGNGRVFTWGNHSNGRLGISHLDKLANGVVRGNKYVVLPQLVEFEVPTRAGRLQRPRAHHNGLQEGTLFNDNNNNIGENEGGHEESTSIYIKRAFCGDKCTVFIDSDDFCWACGDNRFNKLGLDVKRCFKKSIVVHNAWAPRKIVPLAKYKIVSCSIGKNHSTFLTSEGKSLVFGRDIDHTHRLKSNMIVNRESHRRISSELRANERKQQQLRQHQPRASNRNLSNFGVNDAAAAVAAKKSTQSSQRGESAISSRIDYKFMVKSLLANNQLVQFKSQTQCRGPFEGKGAVFSLPPKLKTDRYQRQQVEAYIRKSRATNKKMPFECVITSSCTSKFTLALTNDNRVYFWGTRSHASPDELEDHHYSCSRLRDSIHFNSNRQQRGGRLIATTRSIEPQLVANCSDECFVKIGSTNSTLMANIELLGSDQPIIHARDPRLTANSLADLWILDYQPTSLSSSASSSLSASPSPPSPHLAHVPPTRSRSTSSQCSSCSCSASSASKCSLSSCSMCSTDSTQLGADGRGVGKRQHTMKQMEEQFIACDRKFCQKHDAILEPQPIVSLYVPAMFNHNGCALKLVNLFCFDEDRFFLILDTTVKQLQHHHHTSQAPLPMPARASSLRRPTIVSQSSRQGGESTTVRPIKTGAHGFSQATNQQQSHALLKQPLNMVEESNSLNSSGKRAELEVNSTGQMPNGIESHPDLREADSRQQLSKLDHRAHSTEKIGRRYSATAATINSSHAPVDSIRERDMVKITLLEPGGLHDPRIESSLSRSTDTNDGHLYDGGAHASPVSNNAFSLEEPRSMSTFMAPTLGPNEMIVGPRMSTCDLQNDRHHDDDECGGPMRKLSFGNNLAFDEQLQELRSSSRQRRLRQRANRHRSLVNLSESTTAATGDDLDETSFMPTWVKNEYFDHQVGARGHRASLQYDVMGSRILHRAEDSSSFATVSTSSTEQTCLAELSSAEHNLNAPAQATTCETDCNRRLSTGGNSTISESASSSTLHNDSNQANGRRASYGCAKLSSSSCSVNSRSGGKENASGPCAQTHQDPTKQHHGSSSISTIKSRSYWSMSAQTLASELCKSSSNQSEAPNGGDSRQIMRRTTLSRSQPDLGKTQSSRAASKPTTNTDLSRRRASSQTSRTGAGSVDNSILLCDNIINCSIYKPQARASGEHQLCQATTSAHGIASGLASRSSEFQQTACPSIYQSLSSQSSAASKLNKVPLPIMINAVTSTVNGNITQKATEAAAGSGGGGPTDRRLMFSERISSSCSDLNGRQTSVVTVLDANITHAVEGGDHYDTASDLSDQVTKLSRSVQFVSKKLRHSRTLMQGERRNGSGSGMARSVSLNFFRGKATSSAGSRMSLSSIRRSVMRLFC